MHQGRIQDLVKGGPKNLLSIFADSAQRSCVNEVSCIWLGSMAHLRALEAVGFLAHLVYQPKSRIQSCFVHHVSSSLLVSSALASSALVSVHTSPSHRVRHTNFIFGTHMHQCPPSNMHIKYHRHCILS